MIDLQEEAREVCRRYTALSDQLDPEFGLGGRLLFAGELNSSSIQLVRAANIAGAASFIVSNSAADMRQAMREGVVDFVVTTLDEALRILKNEIRKRQTVSVGIHCADIAAFALEMQERGVQPDLQNIEPQPLNDEYEWLALELPVGNTALAAQMDAVVMNELPIGDIAVRRWYRWAPRYLPRVLRSWRTLPCKKDAAQRIQSWYEQSR